MVNINVNVSNKKLIAGRFEKSIHEHANSNKHQKF